MPKPVNTKWCKQNLSAESAQRLRGTHELWMRIDDDERIFTVRPISNPPKEMDGGYRGVEAAFKIKGM